jgi:hypothetical protein
VHLVSFIIRIYHGARPSECQIRLLLKIVFIFCLNSVICVSSCFMTVDSSKAFTYAVDVTDVHAVYHNGKNPVSILYFVAENMFFLYCLITVEVFGTVENLVTDYRKFSAKLIHSRLLNSG